MEAGSLVSKAEMRMEKLIKKKKKVKLFFQSCAIFFFDKPSNSVGIVSRSSSESFFHDTPVLAVTTCSVYFQRTALAVNFVQPHDET